VKIFLLIMLAIVVIVPLLIFVGINVFFSSEDHAQFDLPAHDQVTFRSTESAAHREMAAIIVADMAGAPKLGREEQLALMRQQANERGESIEIASKIQPISGGEISGEWVIAPGADPDRRLLYIHGGAYMVGSPKSHRPITSRMSKLANAAVLSVDFRLLPEHSRMDGIQDVRAAYVWMIENGPAGAKSAKTLLIAGDSSGGNIALSTIAWARDEGIRAVNAAIVMSPQTDLTLSSPSLVANTETDVMQGTSFGPVVKSPKFMRLLFSFMMHRTNPSDPLVSPLLGDLANLPPTLVQVSAAEMFYDDGARYVNKANSNGSVAELQAWPNTMHVWQAFDVPEADEAFAQIGKFIATHAGE